MKVFCSKIIPALFLFHFLSINRLLASDYPVTTYLGTEQGLSNNTVRCIYQDHNGFMWFGTNDGLNRWDGYNFRVFRNKVSERYPFFRSAIAAINEDAQHNLWIASLWGVSIYNSKTNQFSVLSYVPSKGGAPVQVEDYVKGGIQVDSRNNLYIGAENLGLLFCKNGSLVAQQIPLFTEKEKIVTYHVKFIKKGADDKVWAFVQNKGLCLLDNASMALRLVDSTVKMAYCLETDGKDIWIGTSGGVFRYNIDSHTCNRVFDTKSGNLSSNNVLSLSLDKHRNLWIGTIKEGINVWNRVSGKMEYLQPGDLKYSLSSGDVFSLYEDKESRMWVGTSKSGINIIDPKRQIFQVVTKEPLKGNTFIGNSVTAFFEAPDSSLWIGTDDAGINIWDRKKNTFKCYQNQVGDTTSLSSNAITSIRQDYEGTIWISSYTSGVMRFQPESGTFKRYRCINSVSGLVNPVVSRLYEDRQKILWATTLRQEKKLGALYFYNRTADRFELFDSRLSDLFAITEDQDGNLWGGDLDHLVKIDKVAKKHQYYHVGYFVRVIYEDKRGNFWLGTEGGGLFLFDRKKNKISARYTMHEGLCNNTIFGISEDRKGNLWMSTLNGLSTFNPTGRTFKNYYQYDGLQSNQFNYGAAITMHTGELVFGGIKGLTLFQPNYNSIVNVAPKIFLTGIEVGKLPIEQQASFIATASFSGIEKIKIPYDKTILTFNFAALEYSNPDKIQYAWYLEGWERGWNYSGNTTRASYTRLSEGYYTLRVKCTNSEGVWSDNELTLIIVVLPPWYRSWWAYLLYAVIIGSLIYYYLQYRAKQTRLQYEVTIANLNAANERSEKERAQAEREKERIVMDKEREMNEKKLTFFTSISHEFRTPLTLIINPIKELLSKKAEEDSKPDGDLSIVYRNARRMLSLVDQLLLFRKAESGLDQIHPGKLNIHNLAYEVFLCFAQQAKSKNIDYVFESVNDDLDIFADRVKLEIILYNLLSNALKYTPEGGRISFAIREYEDRIKIVIEDTGEGISKEVGNKLFDKFYQPKRKTGALKAGFGIGLYLVKHFTDQHKGNIFYESKEGKGTVFKLELLKGKAHFPDDIIVDQTIDQPVFIEQLKEPDAEGKSERANEAEEIITEKKSILIVDDDEQLRQYMAQLFASKYIIYQAETGEEGVKIAKKQLPDLIITDIQMQGLSGIELCKTIKEDSSLSHIPVLLLTASTAAETMLQGLQSGADDYVTKPFDNDLLIVRVDNLLKSRTILQKYFYNEITLNKNDLKISPEYKEFLEKCISAVEKHLSDDQFSVQTLQKEMGMSHSTLYRRVNSVSGLSINAFIRFIRLRKAAEILINTDNNTTETAYMVGFNGAKYFRQQFQKVFGMRPSEYIKKYRRTFNSPYTLKKESFDTDRPASEVD